MKNEKISLGKNERDFLSKLPPFQGEEVKKSIKKLSDTYGVSWQKILDFLYEKKTQGPSEKAHRFFAAFTTVDEIFDKMMARILTTLESWGVMAEKWSKDYHNETEPQDKARKKLMQTIVREAHP